MKPELEVVAWNYELEREAFNRLIAKNIDTDTALVTLDSANAAIKEAAPEWISVNDSLPETNDPVLVCECGQINMSSYWRCAENEIADRWCDVYSGDEIIGISHWMPLPRPPAMLQGEQK